MDPSWDLGGIGSSTKRAGTFYLRSASQIGAQMCHVCVHDWNDALLPNRIHGIGIYLPTLK